MVMFTSQTVRKVTELKTKLVVMGRYRYFRASNTFIGISWLGRRAVYSWMGAMGRELYLSNAYCSDLFLPLNPSQLISFPIIIFHLGFPFLFSPFLLFLNLHWLFNDTDYFRMWIILELFSCTNTFSRLFQFTYMKIE